ncbi:helix-turn-helix domain-containing protein [Pelagibacterium limicola]|uniref:helix-turn-helix domain-containing protein n=1 Tax=Pelagibacterium limicola TaxID=2791022 RepID=UPI0018AFBBCF|nr:helix-turn-helix domain-containing protein [Pelagibacterium limicola]
MERRKVEAAERPCASVVQIVAAHKGVARNELLQPTRSRAAVAASRQIAMYLCHVLLGLNLTEVGHYFGRDRTTVSHACARIEDAREDPAFDTEIQGLEDRINAGLDAARNRGCGGRVDAGL